MNSDSLVQLLQKGFRVSLGATAALIEILQDPQRREENLSRLRLELTELAEEWAAKGEMTEQEARNFVDTILKPRSGATETEYDRSATSENPSSPPASTAAPDVQVDLQELTAQIAAIRSELEKLREQDSSR